MIHKNQQQNTKKKYKNSNTNYKNTKHNDWNVFVAEEAAVIKARGNFLIMPHYTFDDHPNY